MRDVAPKTAHTTRCIDGASYLITKLYYAGVMEILEILVFQFMRPQHLTSTLSSIITV